MSIQEQIDKWVFSFKKYFFSYKDGFFELPYLATSPAHMVESLKKMPFMKYDAASNTLHTNNAFVVGHLCYYEVEAGLWYVQSETTYKKNVCFVPLHDKSNPSPYFMLTLHSDSRSGAKSILLFNGTYYNSNSWISCPQSQAKAICHFKGVTATDCSMYFTMEWYEKNIACNAAVGGSWPAGRLQHKLTTYHNPAQEDDVKQRIERLQNKQQECIATNSSQPLQQEIVNFFETFFEMVAQQPEKAAVAELKNSELRSVVKAQQIIINHLLDDFPSIEHIAKACQISPTRLKEGFKLQFGNTLFQYYQQQQMLYARQILLQSEVPIGQLAMQFGYSNATKFAQAFKKHYHQLPSEYRQANTISDV
jgi:AraC-like DNA-binding protein